VKLLLGLSLLRLCRRPIAFTKTLAASAIPPLDETRSQIIAPAVAANEFLWFRLAPHLLPERPCGLSLFPVSFLPGRRWGVSDWQFMPAFLCQFRVFHSL
jgi:hypothetical protein